MEVEGFRGNALSEQLELLLTKVGMDAGGEARRGNQRPVWGCWVFDSPEVTSEWRKMVSNWSLKFSNLLHSCTQLHATDETYYSEGG